MKVGSSSLVMTATSVQEHAANKIADRVQDSFEQGDTNIPRGPSGKKPSLVSKWDIPGIFTFSWLSTAVDGIRNGGQGCMGALSMVIGSLMLVASPVVVPLSLAADVINTAIFPGKVIYRALVP